MKKHIIILTLVAVMSMTEISSAQGIENTIKETMPCSQSAITLRLALRELWEYQVTWMRSYIVSTLSDLEDKNIVRDKLIKNQERIGDAIKPYYGGIAGHRLGALMRGHIIIATEIVEAKKTKNNQALQSAQEKGRKYAERISDLLSRVRSPRWDKQYLKDMFYKHLEYIDMQVDFRLKKDWAAEINAYDDGLAHVLCVSDVLAQGIVHQFPDKFKN